MARKKTIPTEEPEQLHPPENPEETARRGRGLGIPAGRGRRRMHLRSRSPRSLGDTGGRARAAAGETGRRQGGSWRRRHTAGGRSFGRTCPHSGSIGHRAEGGGNSAGHI